ncbi:MAG TPA: quinone-dependent dihydroorotate dehydrogenase [Burkholderiales bacterium]|nr:quinone-dependent dihydroorotate dehydrogenase [Burkholderiales bacterium]
MLYPFLRPLLFRLEAERAHRWTLGALEAAHALGLLRLAPQGLPPAPVHAMGITFPNAVGLAAGLDKNAEHIAALASLGFGHIEVGTVTPRPQPGNPHPRLFRVPQARALINRMGFNNLGVDRLVHNVGRAGYRGILGINIGKNFDTPIERAAGDYLSAMRKAYPAAAYLAVNISSPNTRDLRRLQEDEELDRLLAALKAEQERLSRAHGRYVPLAVKIAPDLTEERLNAIARCLLRHGIDGVIATNTTIARTGVEGLPHGEESGGLSGAPLRERSSTVIRMLYAVLGERIPIIGVGGIMRPEDAKEKLGAGAKLVQLYTGLIYTGPGLVRECVRALAGK